MFEGILQPTHLIIILVIVLVVFGPGKLPEIGGALGRSLNEFKRSVNKGSTEEVQETQETKSVPTASAQPSPSVLCPSCHQTVTAGNEFCGHCGAKVA